ncbi:MAG: hypothetical protein JO217_16385 [Acidobacteriaceae bacterium]|nr:hypothetical protein [Acidobacteriaceae bacterium]MBV9444262.1 hypothetical protein [Acidobacteriaceae bacterium]
MRRLSQVGLVVEGNSTGSSILRLPTLPQDLGPLKSVTLRVARRQSNILRAGYAVAEYEELQAARLILVRVPDSSVSRVVQELCDSELVFKNLSFVLCETWLSAEVLEPLRNRGASIATLVCMPSVRHDWFVVEGQMAAGRQVRRFLERNDVLTSELRPGSKHLLFAAQMLASALPIILFSTAQLALRAAGISGKNLAVLMETMAHKMLKDTLKGGSRANWAGALHDCSEETAKSYLQMLRITHPEIGEVLDDMLSTAHRRMLEPQLLKRPLRMTAEAFRIRE